MASGSRYGSLRIPGHGCGHSSYHPSVVVPFPGHPPVVHPPVHHGGYSHGYSRGYSHGYSRGGLQINTGRVGFSIAF